MNYKKQKFSCDPYLLGKKVPSLELVRVKYFLNTFFYFFFAMGSLISLSWAQEFIGSNPFNGNIFSSFTILQMDFNIIANLDILLRIRVGGTGRGCPT